MIFWCPLHLPQSGVNCDLDFKLITIKHLLKERFLSWAIEHLKVVQVTKEVKNLTVPTFAQFAIPDVEEICSYMNMLGLCIQHFRNTLWKYDCCKKHSPTPNSVRTKDPNNHSDTETGTLARFVGS